VSGQFYQALTKERFCLTPIGSLDRLSMVLGCFRRFLFIIRLLVSILPVLFSRRSSLRLQE